MAALIPSRPERAERSRWRSPAALLVPLLLLGLAPVASCIRVPPPAPPRASVYLRVEPREASVFVDERFIARASVLAEYPVGLAPGVHRLTLTARGHFPRDEEIRVHAGVQTLRFSLLRDPD